MKFSVLASGSKANSIYIEHEDHALLVDCGLTLRQTALRISQVGGDINKIKAIIVTHEHGDHCKGLQVIANKLKVPTYCTQGTLESFKFSNLKANIVQGFDTVQIADFNVCFYPAVHDAQEPIFLTIKLDTEDRGGVKLGILTDMGKINQHVHYAMQDLSAFILEANYDDELLEICEYPWELKQRIRSTHGHLSNKQAAKFLTDLNTDQLQHLVLAHISENSNTAEKALASIQEVFEVSKLQTFCAGSVYSPTELINCFSSKSIQIQAENMVYADDQTEIQNLSLELSQVA